MTRNILVIDEEKYSYKGIRTTLIENVTECKLEFQYERTGSTGLDKIKEFKYDLIILDMMLPKGQMTVKRERDDLCYGVDVLEAIREIDSEMQVICFTNVRENGIVAEIEQLNGTYICKLEMGSNKALIEKTKQILYKA